VETNYTNNKSSCEDSELKMVRLGFPLIFAGTLLILVGLNTFISVGSQFIMPAIMNQGTIAFTNTIY